MSLPFAELEAITNDYFMLEGGKAVDIYFNDSYLMNYFMKGERGLWTRPGSGDEIRVILEYDGQEAAFYSKGDTLNSDDREALTAAIFQWRHSYSNATIYRIDLLKNAGAEGKIKLMSSRLGGAQKSIRKLLAGSVYDLPGGDIKRLTGLRACCHATTTLAYGGIAEDDLVSVDGTKNWKGRVTTTVEGISPDVIRTMATTAKLRDGVDGKPDIVTMPETLFNVLVDRLSVQQRFVNSAKVVEAGFTGVEFEGKTVTPDDYCPSGWAFALNSNHIGFAVHENGYFEREPWSNIEGSAMDKTMKIYFDGNLIVNNRKAHIAHSNLS